MDSPLPESGKTTVLEHFQRLAADPLLVSSLSSPAMLARLLDAGPRTILLDETEKNLKPDREGVGDLLAVINTGYKKGGSRPTSVPDGKNGWTVKEMPTFAPVAMAGISPQLPDDTLSRTVFVNLLPDTTGEVEDSDWEFIEDDAEQLRAQLRTWIARIEAHVRVNRTPTLPDGTKGRMKEKWRPLMRVAEAAGAPWPERITELIEREMDERTHDKEEGLMRERPTMALLRDLATVWPEGATQVRTQTLIEMLATHRPESWGGMYGGRTLTPQAMGQMLSRGFRVRTSKTSDGKRGGYRYADLLTAWKRSGITPPAPPRETVQTVLSGQTVHGRTSAA